MLKISKSYGGIVSYCQVEDYQVTPTTYVGETPTNAGRGGLALRRGSSSGRIRVANLVSMGIKDYRRFFTAGASRKTNFREDPDIDSPLSFVTRLEIKLDRLPFFQRFITFLHNGRKMHKDFALIELDKAKLLFVVKPFDCTLCHFKILQLP